jgi:hypothetical protein
MKRLSIWSTATALLALWLCAGCQQERTLVSQKYVVEGMQPPSDGGRAEAHAAQLAQRPEPPKYREHWWQFWRPPMPDDVRIRREEATRMTVRRSYGEGN